MMATKRELEQRVIKAAMRVYALDGPMDKQWIARLHPTDRAFFRACATLAARKEKRK
jgi:hypothetical protein